MGNILLTRIDNRLVHGQTGSVWSAMLGADIIVVVDDLAAKDSIQQTLMNMTAQSAHTKIIYLTMEEATPKIQELLEEHQLFLVVRTPQEAYQLYEKGIHFTKLDIGNMHFSTGKQAVSKKVYVDEEDRKLLNELIHKGIDVYIQDVPGDKIVHIQ